MFRIDIYPAPEMRGDKAMYFWCVICQCSDNAESSCGHGWSESIAQAAIDAEKYYKAYIGF